MEVDLHVTNDCNFRCKHCVYKSGDWSMPNMTPDTVRKLVDSFHRMGVEEVHITGGEPLVNPNLFEIISILRQNKFLVRMQTNGMLIDNYMAQKLKNVGVEQILISIDGLKDSHNNLRGNPDSFEAAIRACHFCLKNGIFARVNTVVHKSNVSDIRPLIKLIKDVGVDQHSFFYFTPAGRGENMPDEVLSLKEWKDVQETIRETAEEEQISSKIKMQDVYHENDVRYEGLDICRNDNCLILANGNVFHCVFFVYSQYALGNIYNDSLLDIWRNIGSTLNRINAQRHKRCDNLNCGGGCPGMSLLIDKNIEHCDSRCCPNENLISSCIRRYRFEE